MKLEINGLSIETPANTTVSQLLSIQKVKMPDMVSVEINESILDRKTFGTTILKEGDKVEFLYFMGGGK
ncbi:MAG: thiamine biosynthesis protein ThiS [Lentisphaerae bacterium RIFOXYA12_FULL_48_11]|nr:MAG: thiamine biosynthesis protein ThiS [Lentisphaerae bacterium RIFOXYA12_FULL_48_11]